MPACATNSEGLSRVRRDNLSVEAVGSIGGGYQFEMVAGNSQTTYGAFRYVANRYFLLMQGAAF